ncbi:zinc finger MYM-type protein 1 [Anabrus simplex]|uniref:zinc finger MYM-type protein 1 n=1 Tax=Anabrus simplex TaxID=316456 RepID=UPI0035A28584
MEQLPFIKCEPGPAESPSSGTSIQKLAEVKVEPDCGPKEEHLAEDAALKTDVKIEGDVFESKLCEDVARDEEEELNFSASVLIGQLPNTSPANTVDSLLKRPFSLRRHEEKLEVKQLGRPTPDLNLTQKATGGEKRNEYTRKFDRKVYENSWVCGCEIRNTLFCFPCLLFGNTDSWTKVGVKDLAHLNSLVKKHDENEKHMCNVLDLSAVGRINIATLLSRAYHDEKVKHNQQVDKNRYVLSKIIDSIKYCNAFELALRGYDKTDSTENPSGFLGLTDLICTIDNAVKEHMEGNEIFIGATNELVDCMLETCREAISEEIKEAEFIAIKADEVTHISEKPRLALVFRYEKNGMPCERFWGCFNPEGQNTDAVTKCILDVIHNMFKNTPEKIIALTYDGVSLRSDDKAGLQEKFRVMFPNAYYIHCNVHQLNLTMERAASQNQSARVFFLGLSRLKIFFSKSPERLSALKSVVAQRIPSASAAYWNYKLLTVHVVYEYKTCLLECLLILEKSLSNSTCIQAVRLRRCLQDQEFLFWLEFFHRVMSRVNILQKQLQVRSVNALEVKFAVSNFTRAINIIRDSFDKTAVATFDSKRQKLACKRTHAREVCDRMVTEARDCFLMLDHLEVAKLLDSSKFDKYSSNFPEKELNVTAQAYSMLEKRRLKTELSVLYQRQDLRNIEGAVPLLQFILTNSLESTFSQITRLLRILVTTPMTTAEPETINKIKIFLQNTTSHQRPDALAMLSVEKNMVADIEGFNHKVIEKFCSRKQQCMDFMYRQ